MGLGIVQEMEKVDPQASQAFSSAINKGDFDTAGKIYKEFRQTHQEELGLDTRGMDAETAGSINSAISTGDYKSARKIYNKFLKSMNIKTRLGIGNLDEATGEFNQPSLLESVLSGDFPKDIVSTPLQQFGYATFYKYASRFTSPENTPVGPDYIMGPGDNFTVTLWGTTEGIYKLIVTKEGNVTLPKVGVVSIAGLRFSELENALRRHLSRYYSNFNINVSIGKLKTITLYVVGEVANPGSYVASSLTTAYGALFLAGGPTKQGTMRKIQVMRAGKVMRTLDMYDFLLKGDRTQDIRLQHDDTIFVPIIGPVAGVAGSIHRPAIYEFKKGETVEDLIRTAGGLLPIGAVNRVQLYRFVDNHKKIVLDIVPAAVPVDRKKNGHDTADELLEKAQNMDLINIMPINDSVWESVNLQGEVRDPGEYQWRPNLRLKEVLLLGQLLPTADPLRAEIVRLTDDHKSRNFIAINLADVLSGDESKNIFLQPKDQITIYDVSRKAEKVNITGEVVSPGEYIIYKDERLSDLLKRVGGLRNEAFTYGAVFKRKNVKNAEAKNLSVFINKMQQQAYVTAAKGSTGTLSSDQAGSYSNEMSMNTSMISNMKTALAQLEGRIAINIDSDIKKWEGTKDDLYLQDGDSLFIPKRPQEITVLGEVNNPGAQVFIPGFQVRDYLNQAGGATNNADAGNIYVIKANGFAISDSTPSVGNIKKEILNVGDTVFVPQQLERNVALRMFANILDILFKTAVIFATISVMHL